jgi:hypothetical protein
VLCANDTGALQALSRDMRREHVVPLQEHLHNMGRNTSNYTLFCICFTSCRNRCQAIPLPAGLVRSLREGEDSGVFPACTSTAGCGRQQETIQNRVLVLPFPLVFSEFLCQRGEESRWFPQRTEQSSRIRFGETGFQGARSCRSQMCVASGQARTDERAPGFEWSPAVESGNASLPLWPS